MRRFIRNKVIILGLYFPGIDIIKNFKRRGIDCIGVDFLPHAPGFSLGKTRTYLCPDPQEEENEWLEFMMNLSEQANIQSVILNTSDQFVIPLLKNKTILSGHFKFNSPELSDVANLMDKTKLVRLAEKLNIPVPKTLFLNGETNFLEATHNLEFPCLIRPANSTNWWKEPLKSIVKGQKLIKADSLEDLLFWLNKITPYDAELMIQEIVKGQDHNLFYLVVYINKNQECLGYFCGQKLRIIPIHFGSASYMRTTDADPILANALKLLKDSRYEGPAGIEFKYEDSSGEFKLIEINTRFGLWDVMGSKLGVDLFFIALLDLLRFDQQYLVPESKNLYWLSLTRDLMAFRSYKQEGLLTWPEWLRTFTKKTHYADLYWSEPKLMYNLFFRHYLKKIFRNV